MNKYQVILVDASKVTVEQLEKLNALGVFEVADDLHIKIEKEIETYENANVVQAVSDNE